MQFRAAAERETRRGQGGNGGYRIGRQQWSSTLGGEDREDVFEKTVESTGSSDSGVGVGERKSGVGTGGIGGSLEEDALECVEKE